MTTGAPFVRVFACVISLTFGVPRNLARDGIAAVFEASAAEQAVRAARLPGARSVLAGCAARRQVRGEEQLRVVGTRPT
jgi:hypothetical protein